MGSKRQRNRARDTRDRETGGGKAKRCTETERHGDGGREIYGDEELLKTLGYRGKQRQRETETDGQRWRGRDKEVDTETSRDIEGETHPEGEGQRIQRHQRQAERWR